MKAVLRLVALLLVAAAALQLFFLVRIALAATVDPQSTSFQRSEAWRIATQKGPVALAPAMGALRRHLRQPQARGHRVRGRQLHQPRRRGLGGDRKGLAAQRPGRGTRRAAKAARRGAQPAAPTARRPKIVGGSTITQQLAKNLLLSGERTLLRKGQEFVLAFALEQMLSKERILEIYLNSVEWGEGVFGAEAAAQHYFRKSGAALAYEAARLAVMLPQPKYFEKLPDSGYLSSRASTIVARMRDAELP